MFLSNAEKASWGRSIYLKIDWSQAASGHENNTEGERWAGATKWPLHEWANAVLENVKSRFICIFFIMMTLW